MVIAASAGYVTWSSPNAYAQDDEDEEDGGDDEGGDDEGGGEEEEEEDDKDQPAVTAGGLFTMKTFPIRELDRPLTITQKITQARLGLGFDLSNKGAFQTFGVSLEALHGLRDNFMLLGGFTNAYNFQQFNIYGGFEGALAYDLFDIRLAARLGRVASDKSMDPEKVDYQGGDIKFSVDLGFPFRYVARPEIAIIALNTLMSFDFNETDGGANKVTPDFNPSLGIATNPVAPLSVVIFATLQVVDFDFTNKLSVPATLRIQFSPNRKLDIGGEFTLLNLKPDDTDPDGDMGPLEAKKPYDDRFLTLFIASRFGK